MMKNFWQWWFLLSSTVLASCGDGNSGDKEQPKPDPKPVVEAPDIFKNQTDGYRCFRIPAVIRTKQNVLLAFAEGRKNSCSDEGDIDMVLRRSLDNGKTWSELIVVWDDANNTCGNPVPIEDRETGRIHLLMSWNLGEDKIGTINNGTSKDTRRVFYTWSDDDGLSWETPKEITGSVKRPEWGWYATGPCHGLQIEKGGYRGRLVVPCDYIEVGTGRKQYSHVFYSDDHGTNWYLGGISSPGANESTVAELSDGNLILNMRNTSNHRLTAISVNGGESWSENVKDLELIDPVCQGSILNANISGTNMLFFSNAASSSRINMTVKQSIDDGASWTKQYVVNYGPSAYSDIVLLSETQIGILYENGEANPYEKISFEKMNLTDFTPIIK
jgi:sialidase-1